MSRTVIGPLPVSDMQAAHRLVELVDLLQESRLDAVAAGNAAKAVERAERIHAELAKVDPGVLRAAVVLLSTPELRTVPAVVGGGGRG